MVRIKWIKICTALRIVPYSNMTQMLLHVEKLNNCVLLLLSLNFKCDLTRYRNFLLSCSPLPSTVKLNSLKVLSFELSRLKHWIMILNMNGYTHIPFFLSPCRCFHPLLFVYSFMFSFLPLGLTPPAHSWPLSPLSAHDDALTADILHSPLLASTLIVGGKVFELTKSLGNF